MDFVQRGVARIQVKKKYAASIISGLMWTRHFHLPEQQLRIFIGTKNKEELFGTLTRDDVTSHNKGHDFAIITGRS